MKTSRFKATYLNADDVREPRQLTVSQVTSETLGDQEKLVLYAEELDQAIALNKTNIKALEEIFGSDETDDWVGQTCMVCRDPSVMYAGKRVGGIAFKSAK